MAIERISNWFNSFFFVSETLIVKVSSAAMSDFESQMEMGNGSDDGDVGSLWSSVEGESLWNGNTWFLQFVHWVI